jgi:hypothetical protein
MVKYCGSCGYETEEIFCSLCGSLTYPTPPKQLESSRGTQFACTLYSRKHQGIWIGEKKREKYFTSRIKTIHLTIEGIPCVAKLEKSFWSTNPAIKKAIDEHGNNYLEIWLKEKGLLPPRESLQLKGKKDFVILEVIAAGKEFKVYTPKIKEK